MRSRSLARVSAATLAARGVPSGPRPSRAATLRALPTSPLPAPRERPAPPTPPPRARLAEPRAHPAPDHGARDPSSCGRAHRACSSMTKAARRDVVASSPRDGGVNPRDATRGAGSRRPHVVRDRRDGAAGRRLRRPALPTARSNRATGFSHCRDFSSSAGQSAYPARTERIGVIRLLNRRADARTRATDAAPAPICEAGRRRPVKTQRVPCA